METTLELVKLAGLTILPFTLYFAWLKIGHKVAATYTWRGAMFIAPGIGSVTLINMKDRPLAIFDIHAEMDGLSFDLCSFEPPLILKALEATTIEVDSVSQRYIGSNRYKWKHPPIPDRITIYLSTATHTIKCRPRSRPDRAIFARKKKLIPISNSVIIFRASC